MAKWTENELRVFADYSEYHQQLQSVVAARLKVFTDSNDFGWTVGISGGDRTKIKVTAVILANNNRSQLVTLPLIFTREILGRIETSNVPLTRVSDAAAGKLGETMGNLEQSLKVICQREYLSDDEYARIFPYVRGYEIKPRWERDIKSNKIIGFARVDLASGNK